MQWYLLISVQYLVCHSERRRSARNASDRNHTFQIWVSSADMKHFSVSLNSSPVRWWYFRDFQLVRRSSLSEHYEVPDGWHRHTVSDDEEDPDFDPWFNFIQELALRFGIGDNEHLWWMLMISVDDNFDLFDAGLVTFIQAGPGEEWRLVSLDTEGERDAWKPESGWEVERLILYSK